MSLLASKQQLLEVLISFSSLQRKSCYQRKAFSRWRVFYRNNLSSTLGMMRKRMQHWRRTSVIYRILSVNIRFYLATQSTMKDCRWDTFHNRTSMNSQSRMLWKLRICCNTTERCLVMWSTSRMTLKSTEMHWKYLRESLEKRLH